MLHNAFQNLFLLLNMTSVNHSFRSDGRYSQQLRGEAVQFDQRLTVAPSCGVMLQFVTRALSFHINVFSSSIYTAY